MTSFEHARSWTRSSCLAEEPETSLASTASCPRRSGTPPRSQLYLHVRRRLGAVASRRVPDSHQRSRFTSIGFNFEIPFHLTEWASPCKPSPDCSGTSLSGMISQYLECSLTRLVKCSSPTTAAAWSRVILFSAVRFWLGHLVASSPAPLAIGSVGSAHLPSVWL